MALSAAERQARARVKKRAKGLEQVNLWIYPEEKEPLKRFLKELREGDERI